MNDDMIIGHCPEMKTLPTGRRIFEDLYFLIVNSVSTRNPLVG